MMIAWSGAEAADNTRYVSVAGKNTNPCTVAGKNTNPCTLAQPCRTLQKAIGIAPSGGEVRVLDSGFYGNNARINKSLTISGNGHTVYLGNPIFVTDGVMAVALRGLVLNGHETSTTNTMGISIGSNTTGMAVHIERCVIHGFSFAGIAATAPGLKVYLTDSVVRDNAGHGFIIVNSGASQVTIDGSRIENNAAVGINIHSGRATISRSIASGNFRGVNVFGATTSAGVSSTVALGNADGGFYVESGVMTIDSSFAQGNKFGVRTDAGAVARISNSTFISNGVGISASGIVETRENNTVKGSTSLNVFGTLTPIGGI
jgi:hypothetical protein